MASFGSSSAHWNPGSAGPGRFAQLFDDPSHTSLQAPRSILLDSRDRDVAKYPTPSEYVIKLPATYNNVTSARLVSAEIPSSFYVFAYASGNTTLKVTLSPNRVEDIVIPNGNYGFSTIETALETALNIAFLADGVTFTVTIDRVTLKTTLSCSDVSKTVGIVTTTTNAATTGWGLAYYLGFNVKNTTFSGTGSVTSPGVASLNPESYLLISIDPLDRVDESGFAGGGGGERVFAKVPVAVNSFDLCFYDKQITCNAILPPIAKLDQIRVRMRFHGSQKLIDFNGVDHSLTLEVTCSQTR